MPRQTFAVDGLHCGGCVNTVSKALRGLDTVTAVTVDLADDGPSTVHVDSDQPLSAGQVQAALADGNFSIVA